MNISLYSVESAVGYNRAVSTGWSVWDIHLCVVFCTLLEILSHNVLIGDYQMQGFVYCRREISRGRNVLEWAGDMRGDLSFDKPWMGTYHLISHGWCIITISLPLIIISSWFIAGSES